MTDPDPAAGELADRVERLRRRRAVAAAPARAPGALPAPDVSTRRDEAVTPLGPAGPVAAAPTRRRHRAAGSRVVAAGLGATTMFGIISLLGLDDASGEQPSAPVPQSATQPVATSPVQVVIHRVPAPPDDAAISATSATSSSASAAPVERAAQVPDGPIELTANPVVRTVTVQAPTAAPQAAAAQPAPARTSGSR